MINTNLLFCVKHEYEIEKIGENHSHPCYELVYYVNGSGTITIGNQSYLFQKDDYMVCSKDVKHLESDTKGTIVLYIGFEVIGDSIDCIDGVYHDDKGEYLDLLQNIYHEINNWNDETSKQLVDHFTAIVALKLKNKFDRISLDNKQVSYSFENITLYIDRNYKKDIKVKDLARISSYNYDYFRKAFTKKYGKSANEYINEKRISLATDFLKTKEFSVKEIASICGFNSTSHFCTLYKKMTGYNPLDVKKNSITSNKEITKDKFSKEKEEL